MKKLSAIALAAVTGLTLAGAAVAANPKTHIMDVALPDGSVARIEYVGDVAPKVTVAPRPTADVGADWMPIGLPAFAGFDRMIEQMRRQSEAMMRDAQQLARQPATGPGAVPYIASYGDAPAGVTSTSVVSVSNGGATCTRTTEVVSQGPGKPPKVSSSVSGNCGPAAAPTAPAPATSSAPINHT